MNKQAKIKVVAKEFISSVTHNVEIETTFFVKHNEAWEGPLIHPTSDYIFSGIHSNLAWAQKDIASNYYQGILNAMFPEGFDLEWEWIKLPDSFGTTENKPCYVITAINRKENHHYVVATFSDKDMAIEHAISHAAYRGNRYYCIVDKIRHDYYNEGAKIEQSIFSTL